MRSPVEIASSPSRLVLTGFMGSGKTTIGRQLAQHCGWRFLDLDDEVARREGRGIPELISDRGEFGFRLAELSALKDLLTHNHLVLALGGGTPEIPGVQTLLHETSGTRVIYLQAPFEALYQRCLTQANDPASVKRPFLTDPVSTAARYHRRLPLYQSLAHLTVDAMEVSPQRLAESIGNLIKS